MLNCQQNCTLRMRLRVNSWIRTRDDNRKFKMYVNVETVYPFVIRPHKPRLDISHLEYSSLTYWCWWSHICAHISYIYIWILCDLSLYFSTTIFVLLFATISCRYRLIVSSNLLWYVALLMVGFKNGFGIIFKNQISQFYSIEKFYLLFFFFSWINVTFWQTQWQIVIGKYFYMVFFLSSSLCGLGVNVKWKDRKSSFR